MALSTKTVLVWMSYTFKLNDGKVWLVVLTFKNSPVRYRDNVPEKEIITTSSFTKEAKEYASVIDSKIILIDGEHLSKLMAEHNVGVSIIGQYEVKKLDSDYFDNE